MCFFPVYTWRIRLWKKSNIPAHELWYGSKRISWHKGKSNSGILLIPSDTLKFIAQWTEDDGSWWCCMFNGFWAASNGIWTSLHWDSSAIKSRKQLKALVLQAFAVLPMLWTIHPVVLPWHRIGGNIDGRRVLRKKEWANVGDPASFESWQVT